MNKKYYALAVLPLAFVLSLAGCSSVSKTAEPAVPAVSSDWGTRDNSAPARDNAVKTSRPLFFIGRSINTNVVHYDAQLTANGRLVPGDPVKVYWKLASEDGRIEELTWLEKLRAYGFTIEKTQAGNAYKMTMAAAPGRPMLIKNEGGDVYAEGIVNGRPCIIERVFVNLTPGVLGPEVKNIELYGKNLLTGKVDKEVINPK